MAAVLGICGLVVSFTAGDGFAFGAGALVDLVYAGATAGYYFTVIQHVGAGTPGMPGPGDLTSDLVGMMTRGLRGIGCILVSVAPVLVWVFGVHHGRAATPDRTTAVALIVAGQVYMPAVLLAVTFGDSGWNGLWPPAWVQIVGRAPRPYATFSVLWLVTVFVGGALVAALQRALDHIPVAGVLVSSTLSMLFWWFQAILVGRFIRLNAAAFGWD